VTVVDAHAHVIVPGLGPEVFRRDGKQVVAWRGREIRSAPREFCDVERILEEQDQAGIDVVVLSPWVDLCGIETGRQNETLASYVGDRVAALGTIDLERPDELVELMGDGRLSGIELPAAPGGAYLGDDRFADLWAAAEETGALVLVHPSGDGLPLPVLAEHYLWNTVGNPVETTLTAAHMLCAGILDRHPSLNVLLAHGGGALFALRGRLDRESYIHDSGRDPSSSMRRFLVDTVVHDPEVLRDLVEFYGPSQVLLGSDYPFDMGVARPVELVQRSGLGAEAEAMVLGQNALRALGRPGG
jgi:aminocarboxymuconate-semialdehyde decarboxylase